MQVTVTGRHFEVTPTMRSYVEARLDRLHKFLGRIRSAHVTLTAEKRGSRAEIVLESDGREFTSKDAREDMFSAVDSVTHKIEKQLRRYKDKRTTNRKGAARGTNGKQHIGSIRVLRATSVGRGAHAHELLETEHYPIEKLTVDDAILRLEASDQEFMVFSNRATESVHIVYKLEDGNYGVLNLNTMA